MLFIANITVIVVLIVAWIVRLAYEKCTATKRKVDEAARTRARSRDDHTPGSSQSHSSSGFDRGSDSSGAGEAC